MLKRNVMLIVVMDVVVVAIAMYMIFGSETMKDGTGENTEALTDVQSDNSRVMNNENVIATWFTPLIPLTLGSTSLQASVADSDAERQQGLSNTPYLPDGVVKLFVFESNNIWSFWMKDMNYPIDMIWLDEHKVVVHIESDVTPESYPAPFKPTVPARYVIETEAGFAATSGIVVGTIATWKD